jgi:DNA polymerase-3 subunit delta'
MTFSGVVGHAAQRELLGRAVARAAVHPAYLFSGPPGVGKRLVALELARAWLCHLGGAEPCGSCLSCRAVGTEAHPDCLLVAPEERKKSISVDQARELGSWLWRSPSRGSRKAALVDPADALTTEAANALLKTLEEPPPGRIVVLIASRPGNLPPTVRSRCQHVAFGALSDDDVADVLRRNGWPAQAARQAAALAEGSPGVALARDGKSWAESADAVRALLGALERGERGAALAFAERLGESRERVVLALQALLGMVRQAARRRLGASAVEDVPELLERLGAAETGRLLAGALETHRRLEGDRPPNAKLALSLLLLGCIPAESAAATGASGARGRGGRR